MRRLLVVASIPTVVGGCSDGCQNRIVSTAVAPGTGGLNAILFQRDCGATTGFSSQVSVAASNEPPSGGGNAFIADDDHGAAGTEPWGGPWLELRWLSPQKLLIRYDAKSRVFVQQSSVSGVTVIYEKVAR